MTEKSGRKERMPADLKSPLLSLHPGIVDSLGGVQSLRNLVHLIHCQRRGGSTTRSTATCTPLSAHLWTTPLITAFSRRLRSNLVDVRE